MIATSVLLIALSPYVVRWYRNKSKQMAKESRKKYNRIVFKRNKDLLGRYMIVKRERIRSEFREKYGKDIDVYSDCRVVSPANIKPSPRDSPSIKLSVLGFKAPRKIDFVTPQHYRQGGNLSSPSDGDENIVTFHEIYDTEECVEIDTTRHRVDVLCRGDSDKARKTGISQHLAKPRTLQGNSGFTRDRVNNDANCKLNYVRDRVTVSRKSSNINDRVNYNNFMRSPQNYTGDRLHQRHDVNEDDIRRLNDTDRQVIATKEVSRRLAQLRRDDANTSADSNDQGLNALIPFL